MKAARLFRPAAIAAGLFLTAAGTCLFAEKGLWLSATLCLLSFAGTCVWLHHKQSRQLRILRTFIQRKSNGGTNELPVLDTDGTANAAELEREIENMLAAYRRQLLDETAQQQYYKHLLDHVDTGVVSCDEKGEVLWMNQAAEQQLGPRPVLPETWLDFPSGTARIVTVERHGQARELLLSLTRFTLGPSLQILYTLRDIRHVLEQQQIESWKTLTRVLTHEIMNSLTPILSLSKTLASADYTQPSDPEQQRLTHQALQAIHHRSQGLLDFVENYRKLTRLPAPSYSAIPADGLFSDLQKLFHDPRITFDQPYPGFTFRADRGQMEQLLINLVKNAREASAPEGRIEVALRRDVDTDEVLLSVQDHGTGIPADVQERIFVPFFTTKPDGSGIGLSLCKQIAYQHRGTLSVRSVPGKGSRFVLRIPRKETPGE